MKRHLRLYVLVILWIFSAAGAAGLGCADFANNEIDCDEDQIAINGECIDDCVDDGDCSEEEFCEPAPSAASPNVCADCSESGSSECSGSADCATDQECVGCECTGNGQTGSCPPVEAGDGTVGIGMPCQTTAQCTQEGAQTECRQQEQGCNCTAVF